MHYTETAEPLGVLDLAEGKRLAIVSDADGPAAAPMVLDGHRWRRAGPGDGVAEALLDLLASVDDSTTLGDFTIRSWTSQSASGERSVGVDQTNESVIVGDAAVVKWATHLQEGPHPAPLRIGVLRDAGFRGMPTPWGLVTWRPPGSAETLVAGVDEFVAGAVDGWTWAVDLITAAALSRSYDGLVAAATDVGELVAGMHAGLSGTATLASERDAARWRDDASGVLETTCTLGDSVSVELARARRPEIEAVLDSLVALPGASVIAGHGDLHVGQVLRDTERFVVTDFDGNPVLPAAQRALPIPAVLDVAGMTQSLAHAAIVARKYTDLEPAAVAEADTRARAAFLSAYAGRLDELGCAELYDAGPLRAFRLQQVLREIVYAAIHLPRWMYVPDAALPALLNEGKRP